MLLLFLKLQIANAPSRLKIYLQPSFITFTDELSLMDSGLCNFQMNVYENYLLCDMIHILVLENCVLSLTFVQAFGVYTPYILFSYKLTCCTAIANCKSTLHTWVVIKLHHLRQICLVIMFDDWYQIFCVKEQIWYWQSMYSFLTSSPHISNAGRLTFLRHP